MLSSIKDPAFAAAAAAATTVPVMQHQSSCGGTAATQYFHTDDALFDAIAAADMRGLVRALDNARPHGGPARRVCYLDHTIHHGSFDSPITAAVSAAHVDERACTAMLVELLADRNAHVAGFVDYEGGAGDTPLGLAIRRGWGHVVVQLLMHCANPNHVSTRHGEPLLVAAVKARDTVILHAMIDAVVSRSGNSPTALVGLREDCMGMNALATACALGWVHGVCLLLEHGASPRDACGCGYTFAEITVRNCCAHTRAAEIIAALIDAGGIDLTTGDRARGTPRALQALVQARGNRELNAFFCCFMEQRRCLAPHSTLACGGGSTSNCWSMRDEAQLQKLALAKVLRM